MTTGKVKSIEKTSKVPESFFPTRAAARQTSVGASAGGFDTPSILQTGGNLAVQRLLRSGAIQAKLAISQPGDSDEQEADRIAEQVVSSASIGTVQRKCTPYTEGAPYPKREEKEKIQPKGKSDHAPQATPVLHSQIAALRSGGQPLPTSVRSFFEARLGADLSAVRMHDNEPAALAAQQISARAFTLGSDIVFARDAYRPQSAPGRELIAHELAHVLQGRGAAGLSEPIVRRQPEAADIPSTPAPASPLAPAVPNVSAPLPSNMEDKFQQIRSIHAHWWVDPLDEKALERIWDSFGDDIATVASSEIGYALWQESIDYGAELDDIDAIKRIRSRFVEDIKSLANSYLDINDAVVTREMSNAGLSLNEGVQPAPPNENQRQQMQAMQAAAASVAHFQKEMERSRLVCVGYSLGNVPLEAKQYWLPVTFDPFHPPQRFDRPIIDLNDPSPVADHHYVLGTAKPQPYQVLLDAYKLGMAGIRGLITQYPMLYAISREGTSTATQAFTQADPALARIQLAGALRKLRTDIQQVKAKLGKELDPLDLILLHEQLLAGVHLKSIADYWPLTLPKHVAKDMVEGHDINKALVALALDTVSQMAFMLGGIVPGATGIGVLLIGLLATDVKAGISAEQYQAMLQASKTAVAPGTDLVTPAQVDEAKAQNDTDQAALTLAMINTASGIAFAASSWAGERIAALKKDAGSNLASPKAKSLAKLSDSNLVEIQGAEPKFSWKTISIDPATGDCMGVMSYAESGAYGIFHINAVTGDGVAYFGGQTRVIIGGKFQPERPLLGSAATPPPTAGTGPSAVLLSGTTPEPNLLPSQNTPRLPPSGGFDNAFPTPEPIGVKAEPNIGNFYGMRQLPPGYPAYDHFRGGTTTGKFTVESLGTPKVKHIVMNLSIVGGEWLSVKTVLDAKNATPEHIEKVVEGALKDMEEKSGRKAMYDPVHDWYVRVEAASPERVFLHIQVPGEARALVEQLQKVAEKTVLNAGWSPGVPVEVRVSSWR